METRVKRYSKKNRIKRKIKKIGIKKILKMLLKELVKKIICLVVGLTYLLYITIRGFNNIIAKLFIKLPRLMKVAIVYLLIINLGMNIYSIFNEKSTNFKVYASTVTSIKPVEVQNNPIEEQKEQICIFDSTSCKILEIGQKIGLNEEQILISIAISKWETGNYTSTAFKEKNNVGGMMCSSGLINYSSLEEGIEKFLLNLRDNYFNIGLDTIDKIKPKYCPDNADNDPNNLNQYWTNGVKKIYNELKNSK